MPPTAISPDRIDRARTACTQAGVDALLVTPGPDLRWLTGYDAIPLERLTCLVVPAQGDAFLVVPRLEVSAALASPVRGLDLEVVAWDETDDPVAVLTHRLGAVATVALSDQMWAEKVLRFREALPQAQQVLGSVVLRDLRMRKAPEEVEALRAVGAAIDRVHARIGEWLRAGRTEREVGRDIAAAILAEGHDTVDFVIVGSGPNGASPHHEQSDRVIETGDPVVIDIGGSMGGYCSDSTRTYAVGAPPAEFVDYYAVLQAAQAAACEHVRPGVSAESVDAAARTVINDAGWGKEFFHRTGHGIGVETHEEPYIVAGNALPLEPGMAFSVEPGIYLEGRHGARIEDIVVVTEDGIERLNRSTRDLVVLEG
ncbi:MAG TPA: Xaa-Pro peptidase family protein [Actinomycetes bacterium]|nr:Xaa-Pro peptidase family protein [Actinomycetes bacterium]